MIRLAIVVTHPMTAALLLRGQLRWFSERGFDVTVISSPGPGLDEVERREAVKTVAIPMEREIDPVQDTRSLAALVSAFRRIQPDIVNASTPKAALLGLLAARIANVPVRLYTLRGLRLETTGGAKRLLLSTTERLSAALSDEVICVSESLRKRYWALRLGANRKAVVLNHGTSNGVGRWHFKGATSPVERVAGVSGWKPPSRAEMDGERAAAKKALGLRAEAPVVGFVGRLTHDKGLEPLAASFALVREREPSAQLLVVGGAEAGDPVGERCLRGFRDDPQVTLVGQVDDPAPFYRAMDVFAFPSRREGFPNAPLEAAARAVPTVGFRVTGTVDAVVDGVTGMLVPDGDAAAFAKGLLQYLENPSLRYQHGLAAATRAYRDFDPESLWSALESRYRNWFAVKRGAQRGLALAAKRALDVAVAGSLLLATGPVLLGAAATLRTAQGRGVLFRQRRPGRAAQEFELLKFRTMTDARGPDGKLLPDADRLSPVGRWVRRLSIDELPQLVNVLRGDMSLVGPRPLLTQYLSRYSPEQARRHHVYPGITGHAQVQGRNAVDWPRRFELDVEYVDHWNLLLDLRVLAQTALVWAKQEGIHETGQATMREFTGSAVEPVPEESNHRPRPPSPN